MRMVQHRDGNIPFAPTDEDPVLHGLLLQLSISVQMLVIKHDACADGLWTS